MHLSSLHLSLHFSDQKPVSALCILGSLIVSGDASGCIKTWDMSEGQFRLLNSVKMSKNDAAICSICAFEGGESTDADLVLVGTSMNQVLTGSVLQANEYTVLLEVAKKACHSSLLFLYLAFFGLTFCLLLFFFTSPFPLRPGHSLLLSFRATRLGYAISLSIQR